MRASGAAIIGWVLFDWAAQPFFTLLTTFIYAPYFASAVVGDPVRGQALWGFATAAAGFAIALCSPLLGAVADAAGRRKPWIAAFGVVLVLATCALWLGRPQDTTTIPIVLVAFAVGLLAVEFATVFNNAMMPTLVAPGRLGRLSGYGWAIGYVGGIVSLVIMLGWLVASPETGRTLLGFSPLFGLDPALREGDRAAGPFTALWFLVFVIPLFLFTPDQPRKLPLAAAVRKGFSTLADSLRGLRRDRDTAFFLLAHMIYADGLIALFVFGGIFAAGIFGWTTIEMGVFGVLLAISGAFGCVLGGVLDDRLGSKPVIIGSLMILLVSLAALMSIGPGYIGPFAVAPPGTGDGLFAAPAEKACIAIGAAIGFAAGPLQAASRTFLVRIAPAERMTQFFGLYALSGKVTSFLGPLLVGLVTQASGSQRIGISILAVFFAGGMILLMQVRRR
ncbi:MAG TPA: MFS transporter [Xanthobacteraceae bacterium]|nr:MFS transporter [Xanthobacteraceae bacterium]